MNGYIYIYIYKYIQFDGPFKLTASPRFVARQCYEASRDAISSDCLVYLFRRTVLRERVAKLSQASINHI